MNKVLDSPNRFWIKYVIYTDGYGLIMYFDKLYSDLSNY
jgi:hypothetical protein